MMKPLVLLVVALNALLCASQGPFSGTVPLSVKSPYFNSWVDGPNASSKLPVFWNNVNLTWSGLARIDGVTWSWLGSADPTLNISAPTLANLTVTPTRTIFIFHTDKMDLTITYLTPIEPSDPVKQSLPFTYVSFEANSTDGQPHDVQVYSDIGAEWVAKSPFACQYSLGDTGSNIYWTAVDGNGISLGESADQATDITIYYVTQKVPNNGARFAADTECHTLFAQSGPPGLAANETIHGHVDVFSMAMDLGNITATQTPTVWAFGVVRNPVNSYTLGSGQPQVRYPYYAFQYKSITDAIDTIMTDFPSILDNAINLDQQILSAASAVSPQYANLVSLAARQTIGSTELTISKGSDGSWNTSDVKAFMKDVGTSRRVNPVEILFASFPFFLYLNPSYGGQLLSPLLVYADSPLWNQPYAVQDLGSVYPNTTGSGIAHNQGVEQSGNMLIMTIAYSKASGDKSLITTHYDLLKGWAEYLTNNTLTPSNQNTADSETAANNTNLAIKGIIGIRAMAEISQDVGNQDDAQRFLAISTEYARSWQSLALSSGSNNQHVLSNYGALDTSWALVYNLYADKLLLTNVTSNNISQFQTDSYKSLISSNSNAQMGFTVDSTSNKFDTAWTLLTAATVTDTGVRDSLIAQVFQQATSSSQFPSIYSTSNGVISPESGSSSPAQGAMFAILALGTIQKSSISASPTPSPTPTPSHSPSPKKSNVVGPAVGGTIAGLAGITAILLGVYFYRRRNGHRLLPMTEPEIEEAGDPSWRVVPFNPDWTTSGSGSGGPVSLDPSRSNLASTEPPTPRVVLGPSKAREAGLLLANPASSNETRDPSPGTSQANPVPIPEVQGLRVEVENLRREMREIQAERQEAPPNYNDL